jgi:hypothetical protein
MVAWHEVPGKREDVVRPGGCGMIRRSGSGTIARQPIEPTVPYGTDPKSWVSLTLRAGYQRLVRPKQKTDRPFLVDEPPMSRIEGTRSLPGL